MAVLSDDTIITVCDNCWMAACWHGELLCDEHKNAGTVVKTVAELKKLGFEHPDYWKQQIEMLEEEKQTVLDAADAELTEPMKFNDSSHPTDTEMLDWIEKHIFTMTIHGDYTFISFSVDGKELRFADIDDGLREAIKAAMRQSTSL